MRTDIPMINKIILSLFALVLAGIILSAIVCGCDDGLDCLPDLTVEITYVEQPLQPGRLAWVTVEVWNRGAVGTGVPYDLEILVAGAAQYQRLPALSELERVEVNGFVIVPDDFSGSSVLVTATVDSGGDVWESVEDNNTAGVECAVDRFLGGLW